MSTPFCLILPRQLHCEIIAHALAELPNECCGLLAGVRNSREPRAESQEPNIPRDAEVLRRYPLVNAAHSSTEYLSEPESLFKAHRDMRRLGFDILAIYHSHPASEPVPSRKDLERNYYGSEVVHFIVSLSQAEPRVRGWRLEPDEYREAHWRLAE